MPTRRPEGLRGAPRHPARPARAVVMHRLERSSLARSSELPTQNRQFVPEYDVHDNLLSPG